MSTTRDAHPQQWSPGRYFLTILSIVFVAEAVVMALLPLCLAEGTADWVLAVADAGALTALVAPLIWHYVFRPLRSAAIREKAINESIVSAAADGIVTIDQRGSITAFNAAAEALFGYTAEEAIGNNVSIIVPPPHQQRHDEYLLTYLETGKTSILGAGRELPACRKDGTTFPAELSISEARVEQQRFFTGIVRDITTRKRTQKTLEDALHAAHAAAEAKSQFLANMSHEIRTPLTAIVGYAELILETCPRHDDCASRDFPEQVRTISRNSEHLLQLVNDVLDLSKTEAGKLNMESVRVSPGELIADLHSLAHVRTLDAGIRFDVEFETPIPETIGTDPTRLRQVLLNLTSNAIKFTKQGSVRLIARFRENAGVPRMEFDVLDTGVGMTQEQATTVFQPFVQADSSMTRNFGGTGLGLTISKNLTQLLGGELLIVETRPGAGSRFRVSIPTGPLDNIKMVEGPSSAAETKTEPDATKNANDNLALDACRILLAEDGPDNQRLISHLLERAGAQVTVVDNGKRAVEAAFGTEEEAPFDVILMDMQMPVMDGYKATALLREQDYERPIIALTAHTMDGDRAKCMNAGCDGYLTKPIDRKVLIQTVQQHRSRVPLPTSP